MKVPEHFIYLLAAPNGLPTPLTNQPWLSNPNVEGCRWRSRWHVVQPTAGNEDWSSIDAGIAACVLHNKKFGLSVACGDSTPQWVYDAGAESFDFDPANEVGTMPIPWDPIHLEKLMILIARMGELYDLHPNVNYVVVSGFMQHFEGYLAKTQDEQDRLTTSALAAGFASLNAAWTTTGNQIIGAFAEAFPNTAVLYTSAKPWVTPDANTARILFRDAIGATYPGHAGWMTAQLHAAVAPWGPLPPVLTFPHGHQAIIAGDDLERMYGTGNVPVPPPVPPQIMIDYLHNGLQASTHNKGCQFTEIYAPDMDLAANQSTFDEFRPQYVSFTTYEPPGEGSIPPVSIPVSTPISIPGVSVPPGEIPPVVFGRTVVPRIIQCKTGTHARNIILAHKRLGPPVVVPIPPGAVEILEVTTPHEPSSGTAVATFLSPVGSVPAKLTYRVYVTGGPGTAEIIARIPE